MSVRIRVGFRKRDSPDPNKVQLIYARQTIIMGQF